MLFLILDGWIFNVIGIGIRQVVTVLFHHLKWKSKFLGIQPRYENDLVKCYFTSDSFILDGLNYHIMEIGMTQEFFCQLTI